MSLGIRYRGRWGFSGDMEGDFAEALNGLEQEKGELSEHSEFSPFRGKACEPVKIPSSAQLQSRMPGLPILIPLNPKPEKPNPDKASF